MPGEILTANRSSFVGSYVGTMKGVPEEEEEEENEGGQEEVWSSLTTPPPKLPCTLVQLAEEEEDFWGGIPEPPDGGWGWVIVFASFMCNVVVDGIAYSFGIFLIHFVNYYGSSKGKTAWVGSLLTGCYLLAGPVVSALTNKFGCRPVTIAGSVISSIAFLLSTVAPSVDVLMLTYGIMAGLGFGLIYLPAIVSVGYYFSTKRAFATGIAVCGSGMGAFVFAPLTQFLLDSYDWKGALLILAGLALNCSIFGALMRPLRPPPRKTKQNGKSSILSNQDKEKADSGVVLLTEDGARIPLLNTEPGVQSTLNLDQMSRQNSLLPTLVIEDQMRNSIDMVPGLTVTAETPTASTQKVDGTSLGALVEGKAPPKALLKICHSHINIKDLQRRFTMPATMPASTNILLPSGNNNYPSNCGSRGESMSVARRQQRRRSSRKDLARPLYRKDIFYSGSIVHLPQYRQSKADIRCYISSVTTIPQPSDDDEDDTTISIAHKKKKSHLCPRLPKSMAYTLKEIFDFSLLKEKPFMVACFANFLGMMGFYIPFVYITDSSVEKGVSRDSAAFLLSIIGITNLVGRLIFGWIVDKTNIRALDINNMCLGVSGISVLFIPFCFSYASIVAVCSIFSMFVSAYISLTSIILVEMVGLDRLTNSFGLLSLFRGTSSILGPPLAGSVYDWTGSYDIPFYLAGSLLISSGICTFLLRWIDEADKRLSKVVDDADSGRPESEPTTAL